jgi:hypothetical protein
VADQGDSHASVGLDEREILVSADQQEPIEEAVAPFDKGESQLFQDFAGINVDTEAVCEAVLESSHDHGKADVSVDDTQSEVDLQDDALLPRRELEDLELAMTDDEGPSGLSSSERTPKECAGPLTRGPHGTLAVLPPSSSMLLSMFPAGPLAMAFCVWAYGFWPYSSSGVDGFDFDAACDALPKDCAAEAGLVKRRLSRRRSSGACGGA